MNNSTTQQVQVTVDRELLRIVDLELGVLSLPRSVVIGRLLHAWVMANCPPIPFVSDVKKGKIPRYETDGLPQDPRAC